MANSLYGNGTGAGTGTGIGTGVIGNKTAFQDAYCPLSGHHYISVLMVVVGGAGSPGLMSGGKVPHHVTYPEQNGR